MHWAKTRFQHFLKLIGDELVTVEKRNDDGAWQHWFTGRFWIQQHMVGSIRSQYKACTRHCIPNIRVVHVANWMVTCHLPPVIGTSILPWPVVSASKASSLARQKTLSTVSLNLAFNRLLGHGAWSWSHRCGCSRSLQASSGHVWSCRKHSAKKTMQEIPRRWISRKLLCQTRGIVTKPSYKRNDKKMYWFQLNLWAEPSKKWCV